MTRPIPTDSSLPALATLLGPHAEELLATAVASTGAALRSAEISQVRYLPQRSVTAQYRATLVEADGSTAQPMLVACAGLTVPDGTPLLESGDTLVAVWRFPHDPFLPGLRGATDEASAVELLTRLGAPTKSIRLRTRAYRATRRAVVEATGSTDTVFMKVLRPDRVATLQNHHITLAGSLPIPRSLGWSERSGILAMQALPGQTLRRALEGGALELPAPAALLELLDRFPAPAPDAKQIRPAYQRAPEHARLLKAVLPAAADTIDSIVAAVAAASPDSAPVAVHGDFHSSQVLVEAGQIVGLVDVDTAGAGHRVDDLANIIGHLATVGLIATDPAPIAAYRQLLLDQFSEHADPTALRLGVAAVVFGLATGPFRVQLTDWPEETQRRLDLANQWIRAAK